MKDTIENLEGVVSKLKEQGIKAADLEKQRIIDSANEEANSIIEKAKKEQAEIIEKTKTEVASLESNSKAALQQASRDYIEATKIAIISMLKNSFGSLSKNVLTQEQYLQEILKALLGSISGDKTVSVTPEMVEKMQAFIVAESLKDKVEIKPLPHSNSKIVIDNSNSDQVNFVVNADDIKEGLFSQLNADLINKISEQKEE